MTKRKQQLNPWDEARSIMFDLMLHREHIPKEFPERSPIQIGEMGAPELKAFYQAIIIAWLDLTPEQKRMVPLPFTINSPVYKAIVSFDATGLLY